MIFIMGSFLSFAEDFHEVYRIWFLLIPGTLPRESCQLSEQFSLQIERNCFRMLVESVFYCHSSSLGMYNLTENEDVHHLEYTSIPEMGTSFTGSAHPYREYILILHGAETLLKMTDKLSLASLF